MKTIRTVDAKPVTRFECDVAGCDVAIEVNRSVGISTPPQWGNLWGLAPDKPGAPSVQSTVILCPTHWHQFADTLKEYHKVR